jgi:hypothetical protein
MNEVICTAEDNGIKIFYQDTDSMHILDCDIVKLEEIFNKKYNRKLIGKDMGQFHADFNVDGCKNIISKHLIVLGKKCYVDLLECIEIETGKIINDYHIRMKGIPNSTILYEIENQKFKDPIELYEFLYKNSENKINFDLTNGGFKCKFKFTKDYNIETLNSFNRTICF